MPILTHYGTSFKYVSSFLRAEVIMKHSAAYTCFCNWLFLSCIYGLLYFIFLFFCQQSINESENGKKQVDSSVLQFIAITSKSLKSNDVCTRKRQETKIRLQSYSSILIKYLLCLLVFKISLERKTCRLKVENSPFEDETQLCSQVVTLYKFF